MKTGIRATVRDVALAAAVRIPVAVMALIYAALKLLPVRDKVVLVSRLHSRTSADFASLERELARQSPSTTVVILNHRNLRSLAVPMQTVQQMYHLATSRACITDSYMATISALRHRRSLVVVQVWHALGAIKRFGLAALGSAEGRTGRLAGAMHMHRGYDWVIAGGPGMVEPFAESFGVRADQVLPLGTPRVDLMCDETAVARTRARIRQRHAEVGARPLVLYAPTFRIGRPVEVEPLLDALSVHDVDVAVALHPLDARDFSDRPGVLQDRALSTLDWLTVADHVVSDYSAIVFDAAVVGLPLYFYTYDLDEYRHRRGLFLDIEVDLPGPVSRDPAVIAAAVVAATKGVPGAASEDVERFRQRYVHPADGGAARRIVELSLGVDPAELV